MGIWKLLIMLGLIQSHLPLLREFLQAKSRFINNPCRWEFCGRERNFPPVESMIFLPKKLLMWPPLRGYFCFSIIAYTIRGRLCIFVLVFFTHWFELTSHWNIGPNFMLNICVCVTMPLNFCKSEFPPTHWPTKCFKTNFFFIFLLEIYLNHLLFLSLS